MCSLVMLRRPGYAWPLLLAGNRDEMRHRAWLPPARHWDDRPDVVGGLDQLAGGSWFGVNDDGVVAAIMNRRDTLGPQAGKRSRGELVLEALDHAEAARAVEALADLDTAAYREFNLFIGDPVAAYWLRHAGKGVEVFAVPPGVHMLTASDLNDAGAARVRAYLPRFREAPPPDPAAGDWTEWQALLASRSYAEADGPAAAMNVDSPEGFGTVCSHLVAIPRYPRFAQRPLFRFAAGPPDRANFELVRFDC
jgi:uncharacterized protein with NRDE domain